MTLGRGGIPGGNAPVGLSHPKLPEWDGKISSLPFHMGVPIDIPPLVDLEPGDPEPNLEPEDHEIIFPTLKRIPDTRAYRHPRGGRIGTRRSRGMV
jgi:hypothetical protein